MTLSKGSLSSLISLFSSISVGFETAWFAIDLLISAKLVAISLYKEISVDSCWIHENCNIKNLSADREGVNLRDKGEMWQQKLSLPKKAVATGTARATAEAYSRNIQL
jgi:hypothetical protein